MRNSIIVNFIIILPWSSQVYQVANYLCTFLMHEENKKKCLWLFVYSVITQARVIVLSSSSFNNVMTHEGEDKMKEAFISPPILSFFLFLRSCRLYNLFAQSNAIRMLAYFFHSHEWQVAIMHLPSIFWCFIICKNVTDSSSVLFLIEQVIKITLYEHSSYCLCIFTWLLHFSSLSLASPPPSTFVSSLVSICSV